MFKVIDAKGRTLGLFDSRRAADKFSRGRKGSRVIPLDCEPADGLYHPLWNGLGEQLAALGL